jgi:hypothetical protein
MVMDCGSIGGMNDWQGKWKYSEKTCLSAALATTDLLHMTWTGLELGPPRWETGD